MHKLFLRGLLSLISVLLAVVILTLMFTWAPDRPLKDLAKKWAPPPSTFVEVKGLQVHLRDEGVRTDPVPVVLIHGTSASLHTWEGWVDALKPQRRVITMDLPGFGLTGPNAQNDYRNETYTQFILDLMDTLGVERFVVGGNSLGGDIAWQVAERAPQRVDKLILIDAAGYPLRPQSMPIGFRIARTPGINKMMEVTLPRAVVESSVRNVYGDPSKVTAALVDRYEELLLREGNRKALVQRFAQSNLDGAESRIKSIKTPTLILWGKRDLLIPVENAYYFERDIAGSQLTIFDDLGHVPQEEDPQRTVAAVKAFLKS